MTLSLSYDVVDVFADQPFSGNQLAVVHDAFELPDDDLLAITREFNFSEVTFPRPVDEHRYEVRIWTRAGEVPFAGHPTLGTAWVLRRHGLLDGEEAVQVSPVGETAVAFEGDRVTLAAPARFRGEPLSPTVAIELLRRVGLGSEDLAGPALVAGTGLNWLHLPVRPGAVERSHPLPGPIDDLFPGELAERLPRGVNLHALTGTRVRSRVFSPRSSGEDPGTGSAAAGLGIALAASGRLPEDGSFEILQGVELHRPSRLSVEVVQEDGEVVSCRVGGEVHATMAGHIAWPPAGR